MRISHTLVLLLLAMPLSVTGSTTTTTLVNDVTHTFGGELHEYHEIRQHENTGLPVDHPKRHTYEKVKHRALIDTNKTKIVDISNLVNVSQLYCGPGAEDLSLIKISSNHQVLMALAKNHSAQDLVVSAQSGNWHCKDEAIFHHIHNITHNASTQEVTFVVSKAKASDVVKEGHTMYETNHVPRMMESSVSTRRAQQGLPEASGMIARRRRRHRHHRVHRFAQKIKDDVDKAIADVKKVVKAVKEVAKAIVTGALTDDTAKPLFDYSFNEQRSFSDSNADASGELTLTGSGSLDITVHFDLSISDYKIETLSITLQGDARASCSINFTATASYDKTWQDTVATIPLAKITTAIGPVPVVIDANLPIILGFDFDVSASVTAIATVTATGQAIYGFGYTPAKGGYPIHSHSYSYSFDHSVAGEATITLEPFVEPQVLIKIEDIGGPVVSLPVGLVLTDTYNNQLACKNVFQIGLTEQLTLGFEIDITLFKRTLVDKSYGSWTLISLSQSLFTHSSPQGCASTSSSRRDLRFDPALELQPRQLGDHAGAMFLGTSVPRENQGFSSGVCDSLDQSIDLELTEVTGPGTWRITVTFSSRVGGDSHVFLAYYNATEGANQSFLATLETDAPFSNSTFDVLGSTDAGNSTGSEPMGPSAPLVPTSLMGRYEFVAHTHTTQLYLDSNCRHYHLTVNSPASAKNPEDLRTGATATDASKMEYMATQYGHTNFTSTAIGSMSTADRQNMWQQMDDLDVITLDNLLVAYLPSTDTFIFSQDSEEAVQITGFGSTATKGVITSRTADASGFESLGVTPANGIVYKVLFAVDRITDEGTLITSDAFSFVVACPNGPEGLTVHSWTSTTAQTATDVTQDGGNITALNSSHCLVTAAHTSTFAAADTGSTDSDSDSGLWYLMFLLLLIPLALLGCLAWKRKLPFQQKEDHYFMPPAPYPAPCPAPTTHYAVPFNSPTPLAP